MIARASATASSTASIRASTSCKWVENQLAAAAADRQAHVSGAPRSRDRLAIHACQGEPRRARTGAAIATTIRATCSSIRGARMPMPRSIGDLEDNQDDYGFKATLPFYFESGSSLSLSAGAGRTTRDRDSSIRTFSYQLASGSPLNAEPGFFSQPIDEILERGEYPPGRFRAARSDAADRQLFRRTDDQQRVLQCRSESRRLALHRRRAA